MRSAVTQSLQVLDRRLNALGTTEPSIQAEGSDRILVQVPGLQDTTQLKEILGQTARMTFHMECAEGIAGEAQQSGAAARLRADRIGRAGDEQPDPGRDRARCCPATISPTRSRPSTSRPTSRSSPSASTRAARTIFGEVTQRECRPALRHRARRQSHHRAR